MFRGLTKKKIIALGILSLILATGVNFAIKSFAAVSGADIKPSYVTKTTSPYSPASGGTLITSGPGGSVSVAFKGKVTVPSGYKTALRIEYCRYDAAAKHCVNDKWNGFGTTAADSPNSKNYIPATTNYLTVNPYGWMKEESGTLVLQPSGYTFTYPTISLKAGTYWWSVQGLTKTSSGYVRSSWQTHHTFYVKDPAKVSGSGTTTTTTPKTTTTTPKTTTTPTTKKTTRTYQYGGTQVVTEQPSGTVDSSDTESPTVPDGLKGTFDSGTSSINLVWNEATDNTAVSGYEIQRQEKGNETWELVGNVGTAQYTDFEFAPDKTYRYQVRAYDEAQNYSSWSETTDVAAGDFKPNVTVTGGGTVTDSSGAVTLEAPADAVDTDLAVLITKVSVKGLKLPSGTRLVGSYYDFKAKDAQGNVVTQFKRQLKVRFNFNKVNLFGVRRTTLKIATSDGQTVEGMATALDNNGATTYTDHFTLYFLSAASTGFWGTLAWIIFWLLLIAGVGAGGYFLWRRYMLTKYQREHKEDFIYKH